jgi:hypothetical protein
MKRLIIICEGETEQEFCKDVLHPCFYDKGVQIFFPTIKKSNGGIAKWNVLKRQVESHLRQEPDAYVTTLIDLYALPTDYPNFDIDNVDGIEQGMKTDIDASLNYRFIPYIQRHEFECFIFASIDVLKKNFRPQDANFDEIEKVLRKYSDCLEDINSGPDTAPSKRLLANIKGYNKIVDGACLASEIGLPTIRKKCPRFNKWLEQLEKI